jgi:hypothetical protein
MISLYVSVAGDSSVQVSTSTSVVSSSVSLATGSHEGGRSASAGDTAASTEIADAMASSLARFDGNTSSVLGVPTARGFVRVWISGADFVGAAHDRTIANLSFGLMVGLRSASATAPPVSRAPGLNVDIRVRTRLELVESRSRCGLSSLAPPFRFIGRRRVEALIEERQQTPE